MLEEKLDLPGIEVRGRSFEIENRSSEFQGPLSKVQGPKPVLSVVEGSKVQNLSPEPDMIPSGVNGTLAAIQDAKRGKQRYAQQKASRAEQHKREKRLAEVERQIALLETRKTAIEAMMGDGTVFSDPQQARAIAAEYESLKQTLEEQYRVWSTVAEEMEA